MKVKEAITRLHQLHPEATLFTPRDGFSLPIEYIEPVVGVYQMMCEVAPGHYQRCLVENDVCDRKQVKGVLLI